MYLAEKDINNFVDLATATMGEDDFATTKTQSVLNALNGFSPLIYELKPNSNYSDFIRYCRAVWDKLDSNKRLIDDLVRSLHSTTFSCLPEHVSSDCSLHTVLFP